jgi:hypothetical protein
VVVVSLFKKERAAVIDATEKVKEGTSTVKLALIVIGAIAISALVIAMMK